MIDFILERTPGSENKKVHFVNSMKEVIFEEYKRLLFLGLDTTDNTVRHKIFSLPAIY